ncbi:MAG: ThuA domain-containing protein [Armatimonadetes bacterium]|nr:ThuA domain-containing protein [Armatimonadota bacterium]
MKQTKWLALTTCVMITTSIRVVQPASGADITALVSQLTGKEAKSRAEARTALSHEGAAAVPALMALVGGEDRTADREARLALSAIVESVGPSSAAEADKTGVLAALESWLDSQNSLAQRAEAIELLGYVADAKVVPSLTPLLRDQDLREAARRALTLIPGKEATAAVVGALSDADPAFKVALLASLGRRRASESFEAVATLAGGDTPEEVRLAAYSALGQLGDERAERILREAAEKGSDREKAVARKAYLDLGFAMIPLGPKWAATIFRYTYAKAHTEAEKCAALVGLCRLPEPPIDDLVKALSNEPNEVKGALMEELVAAKGAAITRQLAQEIGNAKPPVKVALLQVLGDRGEVEVKAIVGRGVRSETETVRVAALVALGKLGDWSDVLLMVGALKDKSEAVRQAAAESLRQLEGTEVTRLLASELTNTTGEQRKLMVQILGNRGDSAATAALVAATTDTDSPTALAALQSLGELKFGVDTESSGLRPAAAVLLHSMKTGGDDQKNSAARSYMKLAEGLRKTDSAKSLNMFRETLDLAPGLPEKRSSLLGIGRFGDPATLDLLKPYLSQAPLQAAAAEAVVPVADSLAKANQDDQAIELYRTSMKLVRNYNLMLSIVARLRELGVDADLAAEDGYVTHWFALGPFGDRKTIEGKDAIEPSSSVDLLRPVVTGGAVHRWKYSFVDDPMGLLDLEKVVARKDDVAAYLYAEVRSEATQEVTLHFGSDDSVACWLNGKKIHEFLGDRAFQADQDKLETNLQPGANTILLRIGQGGGQWSSSLRITDRKDSPLQLAQKTGLDLAAERGAVTSWWALGPFEGREALKQEDVVKPDEPLDRSQRIEVKGKTFVWKAARAVTADGMVDLEQSISRSAECGGYLYTELVSETDQQALFNLGSDDDVVCWVNGEKVHENFVARPYQVDQDQVKVSLKAGSNTVMLKVLQGGGQWSAGLRITDTEGTPFKLVQKEPGVFTMSRAQQQEASQAKRRVLYYTRTTGFRHGCLPHSWAVMRDLGLAHGDFRVTVNEDDTKMTPEYLQQFDAIVLYTTGIPFPTPESKQALLDYVKGGKGLIGVHSATDTHYDWPEYGELIGAYFDGHPWHQEVGIKVDDPAHPACKDLPNPWIITDEIYQFRNWSRDKVHVLLTIDNATIDTKKEGVNRKDLDFAVSWCKDYGQGRVFFTSLGHRDEVWDNPLFQEHLRQGILWAMKSEQDVDSTSGSKRE